MARSRSTAPAGCPRGAQVADRYDSMTTAELQAEADSRTPAVDLSGATTNAQPAELLRDTDAATPTTTTASTGGSTERVAWPRLAAAR
jgi:hypothetical protein